MCFNRKKGFSLIEVMIVMGIVSLVLAIAAPIFTRRMRGSQSSGCVGGSTPIKRLFIKDGTFTVPNNIVGDVTVTMVGGGGAGAIAVNDYVGSPIIPHDLDDSNESNCSIPSIISTKSFVNYAIISGIANSLDTCSNGQGGTSGRYYSKVVNLRRDESLGMSYSSSKWSAYIDSPNNSIELEAMQPVLGGVGSNGVPFYLYGSAPNVYFNTSEAREPMGVGGSCIWGELKNQYTSYQLGSSSKACRVEYMDVKPGAGGGAGAYAKFDLKLDKGSSCQVVVGKGGFGKVPNNGADSEDGEDTEITCNGTTYRVGGGKHATEAKKSVSSEIQPTTPGAGGSTFSNINTSFGKNGESGKMPFENNANEISGGAGGSVIDKEGNIFSQGRKGGCTGAFTGNQCNDPNGSEHLIFGHELKNPGAGGGGSSCNNDYCGDAGDGADGIVIMEYRVRCY